MFRCMPFFACNRQIDSIDKRQCNLSGVPHDVDRYARSLEELLLDSNHIQVLSKNLFRLHKLRRLQLSDNEIFKLPPDIKELHNLVELDLSKNDISDLPENIKYCKQLLVLDLSSNPITRLPPSVSQLRSLTSLGLSDVSLTQLPQDIGNLSNLRALELRDNLLRSLPDSIAYLAQLQRLDLGCNDLEELPAEAGKLTSLQELYVDGNHLDSLPREIGQLRNLQSLDISENKVTSLPDEIGNLVNLNDVVLSQNSLDTLPHSVGKLKRLQILKVDRNRLISLTPAVGSCELLAELILTENLLSELPSSLGNLRNLVNLNVDKNQLHELPSTVGGCTSLGVLSLRDNLISTLPFEVGRLEKLRVLDVSGNKLQYLPYTINALSQLTALWLSENQSQPMLRLQTETDQRTGVKVLTCYLLPQQDATAGSSTEYQPDTSPSRLSNFVGGPKVTFPDIDGTTATAAGGAVGPSLLGYGRGATNPDVDDDSNIGNFKRHDTPHPKHGAPRQQQKRSIDGTVIPHQHQHQATTLDLGGKKRHSYENMSFGAGSTRENAPSQGATNEGATPSEPKHSSSSLPETENRNMPKPGTGTGTDSANRNVGFATDIQDNEDKASKLRRQNTPHYTKGMRVHSRDSQEIPEPPPGMAYERHSVTLTKTEGGLGLSIAGGVGSTPYKGSDQSIFISRLTPSGPASLCGLRVGDKLLFVSGTNVLHAPHQSVVELMKRAQGGPLGMVVLREIPLPLSLSIPRDASGAPGFAIAGGDSKLSKQSSRLYVSEVKAGGMAQGKLRVGDEVLSINGVSMSAARHDQAVAHLTASGNSDGNILLVVRRQLDSGAAAPKVGASANVESHAGVLSDVKRGVPIETGTTELVHLNKGTGALGLSIVGGADHASHPFGVNAPGVFVSKIVPGGAAAESLRLRVGDRILKVNSLDVSSAPHAVAVKALVSSGRTVTLLVRHDPQPAGLKEVIIVRKDESEPLGMHICGGVGAPPTNPLDRTDEGIFVEQIKSDGAAARASQLKPFVRLLEVNEQSLLGCSRDEAAAHLRNAGKNVRIMFCDGFDPLMMQVGSPHGSLGSNKMTVDDAAPKMGGVGKKETGSISSGEAKIADIDSDASRENRQPPPPVAPKPKIDAKNLHNGFGTAPSTSDDAIGSDAQTAAKQALDNLLQSPTSPSRIPTSIRTKNAENRANRMVSNASDSASSAISEQREMDAKKRQQWRQARMKSLEADAMKAEQMMQKVRQLTDSNKDMSTITESSENMGTSQNTTSATKSESQLICERKERKAYENLDPKTGEHVVHCVERQEVVTRRELRTPDNGAMREIS